jgi:hypothetical protein
MKKEQRAQLDPDGKMVTIFLSGKALEKVAAKKQEFFEKTKSNLSWANAVVKVIELCSK